jgi:YndJ-like protein
MSETMSKPAMKRVLPAFVMVVFVIFFTNDLVEQLLLWAIGVTVPLTLCLTETRNRLGQIDRVYQWCWRSYPWCAGLGAASFLLPKGNLAGLLSVPWLVFTVMVAV